LPEGAAVAEAHFTVLGAGGFIGSHLVPYLTGLGHRCDAPARDDATLLQRPLGDVIYAIGLTADFRSRPLETVEAHVCVLRQLIAKADFRSLTYLSSTRVYSGSERTDEAARLQVNPNDASDLSKLMGESLCLHGGHARMKVARLANIVGLRPDPDIFIDQLLEEGCRTGQVHLRTALQSKKDYLYIDDAVSLLAQIALSDAVGIFNVASGEGVTNAQVLAALEQHMGFSTSVAADAPLWEFTAIDMAKTIRSFGFAPQKFDNYFPVFLEQYRRKKGTVHP
jgi:nucleoside-diphosphate-sugar epimerase